MTPEPKIDAALDKVLKASGSALKNYTHTPTLEKMRVAMREVMSDAYIKGSNDNFAAINAGAATPAQVRNLEAALERQASSGKDWAMRVDVLERTITTLRAQLAASSAQAGAAEKALRELESANSIALQLDARIKELEAQLEAVGAGGVEPLRRRDHFRDATEMVPLTESAIQAARTADYDVEDAPENWAFALGVRFAERAHGITQEQK